MHGVAALREDTDLLLPEWLANAKRALIMPSASTSSLVTPRSSTVQRPAPPKQPKKIEATPNDPTSSISNDIITPTPTPTPTPTSISIDMRFQEEDVDDEASPSRDRPSRTDPPNSPLLDGQPTKPKTKQSHPTRPRRPVFSGPLGQPDLGGIFILIFCINVVLIF